MMLLGFTSIRRSRIYLSRYFAEYGCHSSLRNLVIEGRTDCREIFVSGQVKSVCDGERWYTVQVCRIRIPVEELLYQFIIDQNLCFLASGRFSD